MARDGALSSKQRKAIAALLSEPTQERAANAAGVGLRTLCRWLAEDTDFKAALAAAENEAINQAARLIAGGAAEAVEALQSVLRDEKATRKERTQAARAFLAALPSIRLLGAIEDKISRLEQANDSNT